LKPLDFIQGIITRMAANSFLLKGWTVTLVAGLTAISVATDQKIAFILISFIPVLSFWGLDGYFLYQERLFRAVYNHVRKKEEADITFEMNPLPFIGGLNTWKAAVLSPTLVGFYLPLVTVMTLVIGFLYLTN